MATSNDHPGLLFVQARGFTEGRPDGPPLWIVFHDMEASETLTRAESTAAYFANPSDGRRVSSHYCVDADSVVQCVDLDDSAWTVGNREGNNRGINWELSGFASQTRAQWLDPFGQAMFRMLAPFVRSDAKRFNIPLRWLTDNQVQAMQPGLTTHVQLGRVFGGTTHTDPGPAFPYDVVLKTIKEEEITVHRYRFDGSVPGIPVGLVGIVHVTDGVRYRIQPAPGAINLLATEAGAGPLVTVTAAKLPAGWTYMQAVAGLCGTLDTGESPGSGGGGLPASEVRAIVREELNATRLTGLAP